MKVLYWPQQARAEMLERFAKIGGIELCVVEGVDGLVAALPQAEALVMGQTAYNGRVADALRGHGSRLRLLQLMTAGYDGPQNHGVPPGVVVANAGDSLSPALAEHAMMLMLALFKCLPQVLGNQARHAWERQFAARMDSVYGKTMAVVGYGSVGREIARRARAFDMHVIGVSRSARPKPQADEVRPVSELHAVLSRADVIVLAAPHTAETHHLIDAAALAAYRKSALLINVARGALVEQGALCAALRTGSLAGAGLDVTDPEPLPPDHPLWSCPNLIITPHVSGSGGAGGRARLASFVVDNVARFARGEAVMNVITI